MKILHFFQMLLLTSLLSFTTAISDDCVYTVYVKTGSIVKAGTDSKISLALGDSIGNSVWISDLKDWGLMGRKHDYFERGNTDIFSGRGPCIGSPICRLNVSSDGSGAHHGWYCDSIEVTSAGPHRKCGNSEFYVDRWLADDVSPYRLWAVLDRCLREAQSNTGPLAV